MRTFRSTLHRNSPHRGSDQSDPQLRRRDKRRQPLILANPNCGLLCERWEAKEGRKAGRIVGPMCHLKTAVRHFQQRPKRDRRWTPLAHCWVATLPRRFALRTQPADGDSKLLRITEQEPLPCSAKKSSWYSNRHLSRLSRSAGTGLPPFMPPCWAVGLKSEGVRGGRRRTPLLIAVKSKNSLVLDCHWVRVHSLLTRYAIERRKNPPVVVLVALDR